MTKTKADANSRRPAGKLKIVKKTKEKSAVPSRHAFDEGYEAGWKAGLAKGYLDGFDSVYASEN